MSATDTAISGATGTDSAASTAVADEKSVTFSDPLIQDPDKKSEDVKVEDKKSEDKKSEDAKSSSSSDVKSDPPNNHLEIFRQHKDKFNLRLSRDHTRPKLKLNFNPNLPAKFSLREKMGSVWAQGSIGSCTANAVLKLYQYHNPDFVPSRMFQYQQELIMDGCPYQDNGSTITTAFASLKQNGVCAEETWPYLPENFDKPAPTVAVNEALMNRSLSDGIVSQDINDIKSCIADPAHQNPISFGALLFDSIENASVLATGIVPTPNPSIDKVIGGHAITLVGYDDTSRLFEIMNSWGPNIGDRGFFYFPYEYLLNKTLTSDFHTLYKTSTETITDLKVSEPAKAVVKIPAKGPIKTIPVSTKKPVSKLPSSAPAQPAVLRLPASKPTIQPTVIKSTKTPIDEHESALPSSVSSSLTADISTKKAPKLPKINPSNISIQKNKN